MNEEFSIEKLKEACGSDILEVSEKNERRAILKIRPDAILRIAGYLFKNEGFRFVIATALHTKRGFEVYYHFSLDRTGLILNLHVILDGEQPKIESMANMFSASNWIEREIHELFGIDFLNHPNQEKLISEGNWAEGVYPMRKDFN